MDKTDQSFISVPKKKDFSLEGEPQKSPPQKMAERVQALAEAQKDMAEKAKVDKPAEEPRKDDMDSSQAGLAAADVSDGDFFLLDASQRELMSSLLSPEQELLAEKRSTSMSFGDMIQYNEFRQTVKITDDLSVSFRSISEAENLKLYELLQKDSEKSIAYTNEKMSAMSLTCSLRMLRSNALPNHMVNGEFNEEAFDKKFKLLTSLPGQLVAILMVHSMWFDKRVRRLFLMKENGESGLETSLKNG